MPATEACQTQAPADGWLVLDKPPGITSAAAVGSLRRLLGIRKAGHSGTLDPFATGVLPVAFGEATKTVPIAVDGRKQYRFTVTWGEARDTDDATGQAVGWSADRPGASDIAACLPTFTGEILQRPPDFSAVHVDGERAHALARRGKSPRLQRRPVVVHSFRLVAGSRDSAEFEMTCGKGTYVRSIARDMGEALGCLGHVAVLRRLRAGPFRESASLPLEKIRKMPHSGARRAVLLPISAGLADIPAVAVTAEEARCLRRGQAITPELPGPVPGGTVAWASRRGSPVSIGRVEDGMFRPSRVFQPPGCRA